MTPHVVLVGDVMLDRDIDGRSERLAPDAPVPVVDVGSVAERPGGAGLAALMCAESGARVTLVAPVADDDDGRRIAHLLSPAVRVVPMGHGGPTRRKSRIRSSGHPLVRVDEGGPGTPTHLPADDVAAILESADVVLVSDYGGGVTADRRLRTLLATAAAGRPLVWDPHPRGAPPVPGTLLATPNVGEARDALADGARDRRGYPGDEPADQLAIRLADRWPVRAVCVTAGAQGAFLVDAGGDPQYVPAPAVRNGDPCGAGDRFAASAALVLAGGGLLSEAVASAVRAASRWVGGDAGRSGPVGTGTIGLAAILGAFDSADPAPEALGAIADRLRRGRRTLVATGGCFDIVHAGHVATLQAARRLGDALVVLLNSDASVARLKGRGRPVIPAADRARVLGAFDCVDAVAVFDEDDPCRALRELRPDVWVKGGDYGGTPLPEGDVVRGFGGRVVLLPYLSGRSTTTILERSRYDRTDEQEHA